MEPLAKLLQQAQAAVLATQEDVATMRTQLDSFGDEAIGNPCVIDLQVTIQQKQEAAADLLKRSANLFYESMGALDEKARALGNITTRERELEKTKKAMQRYFDAQKKTQDELKDEYDALLTVQEHKLEHLTEAAADAIQANADRRMQRTALSLWLKKAMIRSFWRLHERLAEEKELQRTSLTQDHEALAEDVHAAKARRGLQQRLFHSWERRAQRRVTARLRAEVSQLEKEAEFFRTECATTQRVLSGHLQGEHAKMQLATQAQFKECELLDDEVGRLKRALTEMTGEFSERTQTYVRQQEETELFFKRKVQKLRDALAESQTELERVRGFALRFDSHLRTLGDSTAVHLREAQEHFWSATRQKEALFAETAVLMLGRMAHRHKDALQQSAELRENVELLAPLSEKVLRMENNLAASVEAAAAHKKAAREAQRQVDNLRNVSSLLTDHLEHANHHKLRSFYFMCWATQALAKRKRVLEADHAELAATLKMKQKDVLVQQQGTAAGHRAEKDRLASEIADQKVTIANLRKVLKELTDQYERTDSKSYQAQMDINTFRAQLSRAEQERASGQEKLAAAAMENLLLEEDNRRYRMECKEVKWRWGTHQQDVDAWRAHARELADGSAQLVEVCEQWQQHSETLETTHRSAIKDNRQQTINTIAQARDAGSRAAVFAHWKTWAHHTRLLASTSAAHNGRASAQSTAHAAAVEEVQLRARSELAALAAQHDEALAGCTTASLLKKARQADLNDTQVRQLQARHAQAMTATRAEHQKVCDGMAAELTATRGRLDEVGDLVVLYCAQASFSKWRACAQERRAARVVEEQLQQYRLLAQRWMTSRAELVTLRYQQGDELLLAAIHGRHEYLGGQQNARYLELVEKYRKLSALFDDVTDAGEQMERDLDTAKSELRKLNVRLAAERDHAAAVQGRLTELTVNQDSQRLLYERVMRHQQRLGNLAEEHLQRVLLAFDESGDAAAVMYADARALAAANAPPDVSPIPSDRGSVRSKSHTTTPEELGPNPINDMETLNSLVLSDDVLDRLQALEKANRSYEQSHHTDWESLECINRSLADPFVTGEPSATAAAVPRGLPARRRTDPDAILPSVVEAALEVVRRSAMCLVASKQQRRHATADESREKLESVEETLRDVRCSMQTMLEEQRRIASEMRRDADQSRLVDVSPDSTVGMHPSDHPQSYAPLSAHATPQPTHSGCHTESATPALLMDAWSERLDMLTSRYQRVLNALHNSIEERRSTFYSVNGMLVEAEIFSEELLARFEANMREMERIKASLLHGTPDGTVAAAESRTPAARGQQAPPERSLTSDFSAASAAAVEPTPTPEKRDSPEKILLRDRVELLEKLLVQSKLQLAETRQLIASGSAALASAQNTPGAAESSPTDTAVRVLRETAKETQRAHAAQLMRVRADTEQLVALRCKEAMHRLEARINDLLEKIDDNNRHYESEKLDFDRRIVATEGAKAAAAEDYERAVQQLRRSFQRDLDELAHENTLLQQELRESQTSAASALQLALEQQRQLLAMEHEERAGKIALEAKQLAREKESLQQCKETSERDLRRVAAEERRALESAIERHKEQIAALEDRYEGLLDEAQSQPSGPSQATLSANRCTLLHLEAVHHRYQTATDEKASFAVQSFHQVASAMARALSDAPTRSDEATLELSGYMSVLQSLSVHSMSDKCDLAVSSSLASLEEHYGHLLTTAMERLEWDREELETENMQLREQLAAVKAASEERSATCTDNETNDLSAGGRTVLSPSMPQAQSSPDVRVAEPDTPVASSRLPPRGVDATGSPLPTRDSASQTEVDNSVSPERGTPDSSITPARAGRDRSLDSLELSQGMLRYSRHLQEQEERNAERLNSADALTAHVDDLIRRGERIREFAEREHLTPKRRR